MVLLREFESEGAVLELNGQLQAQNSTSLFSDGIFVPLLAFTLPLFHFPNLHADHKNRWTACTSPQSRRLRFSPWTSVLDISDPSTLRLRPSPNTPAFLMPTTRTERQRPNGPQNTSSPLLSMGSDVLLGPTSTQAEPADAWLPPGVKDDLWFDCASLTSRSRSESNEPAPGRDPTAPFLCFPFVCFPLFVLVHAGLLTRM